MKRLMIAAAVVAIHACSGQQASAAGTWSTPLVLPDYDVDNGCKIYQRDLLIRDCIQSEQTDYDLLKLIWSDSSDSTKRRCLGYSHRSYRYYGFLASCVLPMLHQDRLEKMDPHFQR